MENNLLYIDKLLSLKKNSQFEPFLVEWLPLYGVEKKSGWIIDDHNNGEEGIRSGERFTDLLNRLTPSISSYPYTWSLEGQKIDPLGYDFSSSTDYRELEIEQVAYLEALRKLNIPDIEPEGTLPYEEAKRVSAPHLTKMQLTLEKASPLSTLSFKFFSRNPVSLLSLVSERDLSGVSSPEEINLDQLELIQKEDTVIITFGSPIFTKRLTFVLGQRNATSNTYYINQEGEDFTYTPKGKDIERLKGFISNYNNKETFQTDDLYTDEEIKDWSEERKRAYVKWRDDNERRV